MKMRLTAGKLRNRFLLCKSSKLMRPTSEKVRQAIFNSLQNDLSDANVLDLFAGTGAMGFEALSRGASFAVFIDNRYAAHSCIIQNAKSLSLQDHVHSIAKDFRTAIKSLSIVKPFDFIFVDPPYAKTHYIDEAVILLKELGFLSKNTIIVVETSSKKPNSLMKETLSLYKVKTFGETAVHFCHLK